MNNAAKKPYLTPRLVVLDALHTRSGGGQTIDNGGTSSGVS